MCHTKQFSRFYGDTSWVCWNLIQSWHSLPRVVQSLQVNGSVPQDCPSLQMPTANTGSPGDRHFCLTWLQTGRSYDPPPPSSVSIICYNSSQNPGKYFIYDYQSITENMTKDTNEKPNEEVQRVKSRRVPSAGACLHGVWGAASSQLMDA